MSELILKIPDSVRNQENLLDEKTKAIVTVINILNAVDERECSITVWDAVCNAVSTLEND